MTSNKIKQPALAVFTCLQVTNTSGNNINIQSKNNVLLPEQAPKKDTEKIHMTISILRRTHRGMSYMCFMESTAISFPEEVVSLSNNILN